MEKDKKQKKIDLSQLSDLDFAPNWDNKYIAGEKQTDRFKPKRQEHKREFKRKKKEIVREDKEVTLFKIIGKSQPGSDVRSLS